MKKLLTAALFLLFPLSAICQTESFTRSFFVELHQDGNSPKGSFAIKRDQQTLPGTSSYLADTNSYAESIFPHDDQPRRLGGFGLRTSFSESISWELIYAAGSLVAYQLVMTSHDSALSTKAHSWIPVEAFLAVGWLLQSYWNTDSPMFSPTNKLEASQDDPFAITTMVLPGNGKKQRQQKNEQTESSGRQASGTSAQITGSVKRPRHSGSGGGNEEPEQPQHTLGLDCYVDSCHGVCKLRPSSHSEEPAEWSLNPVANSTGNTGAASEQSLLFTRLTLLRQRQIGLMVRVAQNLRHQERMSVTKRSNDGNTLKSLQRSSTGNSALLLPSRQEIEAAASTFISNCPQIANCLTDPASQEAAINMAALHTLYSIPYSDDSQEPKRESKKALCAFVINHIERFNIIFPYIAVPGCGRLKPERFLAVMLSL
ncbi:hypothetical protein, partial [Endozoicomonas sp. SESOKO2]|uniref:hypothetical protein n=1 Tax=Endozoicomonas sp. SESOKO2 TaxID=2828743 RepID=UPI0021473374